MAERKPLFLAADGFSEEMAQADTATFGGLTLGGNIAMGSNNITGMADAVNPTDAVTLQQLNSVSAGLDFKESVRWASAGSIANLSSVTVADPDGQAQGITLVEGDRVLIKDTASLDGVEALDAKRNGIYVVGTVTTGTAPLTRATDADTSAEVTAGMFMIVEEGNYADSGWVLSTDDPITLDTTGLTFTQFTTLADLIAGAGINKSVNTISVDLATDPGLQFDVGGNSGKLEFKPDTLRGLDKDASGAFIDLATNAGLQFTSGDLDLFLLSTGGLDKGASGAFIKIDDTPDTLDVDANGLKVVGLPSLFKINDVAVGSGVTAANLDTLTNGSNADALHVHAAATATEAPKVENTLAVDASTAIGDVMYFTATGDRVSPADAATLATTKPMGVARTAQGTIGQNCEVVSLGEADGVLAGATPGDRYYLAAGGGLTATRPTGSGNRVIQIGHAMTATDLWVEIQDYGRVA